MTLSTLLQVSASVIEKSAEMAIKDPHGVIITLVSVSVVFSALIVLYIAYAIIGKIVSGNWKLPEKKKGPSSEEATAISMALHMHHNDTVHDNESYIITIKRKQ